MTCKKHGGVFYLKYKLFIVVAFGVAVSVGLYFSIQSIGQYLIDRYYMDSDAVSERLSEYEQSFESFVIENDIAATDVSSISKWVKEQKTIYLILYDGNEIIYESGWWDEKSSAYMDEASQESIDDFEETDGLQESEEAKDSSSEDGAISSKTEGEDRVSAGSESVSSDKENTPAGSEQKAQTVQESDDAEDSAENEIGILRGVAYVAQASSNNQENGLSLIINIGIIGDIANIVAENAINTGMALNQAVYSDSNSADTSYRESDTGYESSYSVASVYYVPFSDGIFAASIIEFSELKWYDLVRLLSWAVFILSLFLVLLTYNSYITKRIIKLSKEVAVITQGTWDADISCQGNDEISQLAVDIDDLRVAMMEQLEREKAVWNVNRELITSMSHDIRTPLTALIGYLDILDAGEYRSEEERERYIGNSRQKALQLKDLSDKMFQYFLVFGKDSIEMSEETYNVGILLQQIFGEQLFYLQNTNFNVITDFTKRECSLTADIHYLKRLFDNLFSNVKKYAADGGDVLIKTRVAGSELLICIGNDIRTDDLLVESTNIGLKTCQKIVEQMKGRFSTSRKDSYFEVRIVLPVELNDEESDASE